MGASSPFPIGSHAGVLVAASKPVGLAPAHHGTGTLGRIVGWAIAAAVVWLVVKFVKGQRNKAQSSAAALSAAMASLVAAVNASSAANAAAAGGDARSAVALNIGGIGQPGALDRDQLASAVAVHVLALLRAELPHDLDDGRPHDLDDRRAAELPAGHGARSDFDAYGDLGRRVFARAVPGRAGHREPLPVTP